MKIRIDRTRMAMLEPAYAYDVNVPTTEVDRALYSSFIIIDGQEYVSFEDATLPVEHHKMEKGWPRYQAYLEHEKRCKLQMLELARAVFPELSDVDKWPTLWVVMPDVQVGHATKHITL